MAEINPILGSAVASRGAEDPGLDGVDRLLGVVATVVELVDLTREQPKRQACREAFQGRFERDEGLVVLALREVGPDLEDRPALAPETRRDLPSAASRADSSLAPRLELFLRFGEVVCNRPGRRGRSRRRTSRAIPPKQGAMAGSGEPESVSILGQCDHGNHPFDSTGPLLRVSVTVDYTSLAKRIAKVFPRPRRCRPHGPSPILSGACKRPRQQDRRQRSRLVSQK